MEQLTNGLLRRSSDAVVIIGLADGRILDVNEAFFTLTGHARRELLGRPWRELLVRLEPPAPEVLNELKSLVDAQIGLWTRLGELRVGELSVLVLGYEGQRDALCTIRELRDPTPGQRRSAAREELRRLLRDPVGPEATTRALQALGGCLRWDIGTLWRGTPPGEDLYPATEWHGRQSGVGPLSAPIGHPASAARVDALAWVGRRRQPRWIADLLGDPELSRASFGLEEPMHGWLAFPALGAGGVIGVVELLSREARQPDAELMAVLEELGRLFGRLIELQDASRVRLLQQSGAAEGTESRAPGAMPAAFRELAGAVAAAAEALERQPTLPPSAPPSVLLAELQAQVGRLNRLLEHAVQRSAGGAGSPASPAPSAAAGRELLTGLTLKAVSGRTGIPAATLRTWEHRYGFMRPRRSPSGYRLYGDEEIARIERVKYLVGQGVRLGAAMQAVIEEAEADDLTVESPPPADQLVPPEEIKHAEVYRLDPRTPRGRRS